MRLHTILAASVALAAFAPVAARAQATGCGPGDPSVSVNAKAMTYVVDPAPVAAVAGASSMSETGSEAAHDRADARVMCMSAAKQMGAKPLFGAMQGSMMMLMPAINAAGLTPSQQQSVMAMMHDDQMHEMSKIRAMLSPAQEQRFDSLLHMAGDAQ